MVITNIVDNIFENKNRLSLALKETIIAFDVILYILILNFLLTYCPSFCARLITKKVEYILICEPIDIDSSKDVQIRF